MDNRPIGIFDSGVGGFTVASQIMNVLPFENTVYFGDTARFPYGSKSKQIVLNYSKQIIKFLKTQDVKAIIIACNTISSNCYKELQAEFKDVPIIEIINSAVEAATLQTKNKKIGVLATEATKNSFEYENRIKKINGEIQISCVACPKFAQIVENNEINSKGSIEIAKIYLSEILKNDIDTLVLGCTHYPLLKGIIQDIIPKNIKIIDPAFELSNKMKIFLEKNEMLNAQLSKDLSGQTKIFASKLSENFSTMCSLVLNKACDVTLIDIEKY